jgi:2-oxoglutarate ferredoxin oxidoreductase subunit beta
MSTAAPTPSSEALPVLRSLGEGGSPSNGAPANAPRGALTKKALTADHPTWCPGCGDFAVLAAFYRVLEKLQYPHENIVTFAGIGCSSRFPYFVNTHGGHFIHGRSLPFAAGISLGRDDLHVFVFGGDGDGFSIGGNHLVHTARKNVRLTYVIMDNFVYGLTKKQTSPTSPIGFKSKTDPTGALDQPINPMRTLVNSGATFVARSHATQVNHMIDMMTRAAQHDGFSVVEILSECVEFYAGAFDAANPRKGGAFRSIELKKNDGTPEDAPRHDPTDELAAYKLATEPWPGSFGVFYEVKRPTKNRLEADLIARARERTKGAADLDLLQASFARLR